MSRDPSTPNPDAASLLAVRNAGGGLLLRINPDGSVDGTVADASEAGRVFAASLVAHLNAGAGMKGRSE